MDEGERANIKMTENQLNEDESCFGEDQLSNMPTEAINIEMTEDCQRSEDESCFSEDQLSNMSTEEIAIEMTDDLQPGDENSEDMNSR